MKQNINVWFKIQRKTSSINGLQQYIFYLSNLDIYRFIKYSNTLRMLENIIDYILENKYGNTNVLKINKCKDNNYGD